MSRTGQWALLAHAMTVWAGCGLFAEKKPVEEAPERREVRQDQVNWDERIGKSGMQAYSDRIGAASIETLAMGGPDAAPKIADYLLDPSPRVRDSAVRTLAKFGKDAEPAVPKILDSLRNVDPAIRAASAEALAHIGSPQAEGGLERARKDRHPRVRVWAHAGLSRLEGDCEDHMEEVADILQDGSMSKPLEAVEALGFMGCANQEVIQTLIGVLERSDEAHRAAAARAIGQIGPRASAAVPSLMRALGEKSWRIRQAALLALAKMGTEAAPAIPLLMDVLRDPTPRFRELAAHALGAAGPRARSAVDALKKATLDQEATVQAAAKRALANILRQRQPATGQQP